MDTLHRACYLRDLLHQPPGHFAEDPETKRNLVLSPRTSGRSENSPTTTPAENGQQNTSPIVHSSLYSLNLVCNFPVETFKGFLDLQQKPCIKPWDVVGARGEKILAPRREPSMQLCLKCPLTTLDPALPSLPDLWREQRDTSTAFFFCLFFCLFVFGFLTALTVLEPALYTRLSLNSQRSSSQVLGSKVWATMPGVFFFKDLFKILFYMSRCFFFLNMYFCITCVPCAHRD